MRDEPHITTVRDILRAELPRLTECYEVASLGVFGSRVRGDAGPDSDLDILVRFLKTPGLLRFIELENHLSDLLGLRVDLVMAQALKPAIGKRVLEEVIPV